MMKTIGTLKTRESMAWGAAIFFGFAAVAMGNGGGYFRGGVEVAGDVQGFEPVQTEKVQIKEELLRVRLHEEFADVEVNYVMKNLREETVKVRFGFPVEESVGEGFEFDAPEKDDKKKEKANLLYCEKYQITENGAPVKAEWQGENQKKGGDRRFESIAGWLISELEFGAGESKQVRITFRSRFPDESSHVSDNSYRNAAKFVYRLSTAAVWGGPIGKGRIELIPVGIPYEELRVIKPVNRFKREGNMWVWEFENLEPTMADDLEVEARSEQSSYYKFPDEKNPNGFSFVERGEKWFIQHANYAVSASSVLKPQGNKSYEPEKLKSMEGVWSEGASGAGVGEWLELQPMVAKPLRSIRIISGFAKDKELFVANARPKKVEVLINGEHRFTADLLDATEEQGIVLNGYEKPVTSVKLTFLEVYPGKKFEDLCVSQIRLEALLKKKPEITPAR